MRKARTALGSSSEWNLGDNGIPITIQPELQCSVCDEWGREALPLLLVMFHPCILRCLLLKAHHRTTTYLRNRKGKSTLQTGKQKSDSSTSLKEVVSCQGLPYPWGYNWNLKLPWVYQGTGTVESLSFPLLWYLSPQPFQTGHWSGRLNAHWLSQTNHSSSPHYLSPQLG